jgi:phosphoglycerate kinase
MVMSIQTLDQVDVSGKRVLVRVDFNVPLENGQVMDSTRIQEAIPTIQELRQKGAKVILLSHAGRPKGSTDETLSLRPIAAELYKLLGNVDVYFAEDCIGQIPSALVDSLKPGEVAMLENLRFHAGEEANDDTFAAKLAFLGDIYVNDAFSVSHRSHASVTGITKHLPSYAGRLLEKELQMLESTLTRAEPPFMAIVGGAKISTKIGLLKSLTHRVDTLAIVGAMANTFLYAAGYDVGRSLYESEMVSEAIYILQELMRRKCHVILPRDCIIAEKPHRKSKPTLTSVKDIPDDQMILDVGVGTLEDITAAIDQSKTVVWNGALGVFEVKPFDYGTKSVALHLAEKTKAGEILSVAGGGDTVAALNLAGCFKDFTYVSMAGGAFLEWLQGYPLPGVEALRDAVIR